MVTVSASLTGKPCRACGERSSIRGTLTTREDPTPKYVRGICARCLAKVIDAAYGWRTEANIAQGLTAHELGKEIQARKRARRLAS